MADFDYVRSRATADRLIKKFGKMGQIKRETAAPGWQNAGKVVWTYNTMMVNLPANTSKISDFDIGNIEGLVLSNVRFYIASVSMKRTSATGEAAITPAPGDVVTFKGETATILGCTPLDPNGTPVLYKFAARV